MFEIGMDDHVISGKKKKKTIKHTCAGIPSMHKHVRSKLRKPNLPSNISLKLLLP
jgi:hypothetical protein